jgi:hypothetical protein
VAHFRQGPSLSLFSTKFAALGVGSTAGVIIAHGIPGVNLPGIEQVTADKLRAMRP